MTIRHELENAQHALAAIARSGRYKIILQYGFQRDVASGRTEWRNFEIGLGDRALIVAELEVLVADLKRALAKELRAEAGCLDPKGT